MNIQHFIQKLRWNLWWRKPLHNFYRWYLEKLCNGDHHTGEYGDSGRYIVLMTEPQYNRYTNFSRDKQL